MTDDDQLGARIQFAMNGQGFGFQEAVLRACDVIRVGGDGNYGLIGREVPVSLAANEFHVDGVLSFRSAWQPRPQVFVALECKRVNPAFGAWVFGRTDVASFAKNVVVLDMFSGGKNNCTVRAHMASAQPAEIVQVGLDIRLDKKGDCGHRGLEDAVAQAWRGAHGYAHVLAETFEPNVGPWRVQPLIVTTAELLIYRQALQTADVQTGELTSAEYDRVNWLWLDRNLNRSLMPNVARRLPTSDPTAGDHVIQRHRRAVAICRPEGLQEALSVIALQDLYLLK